MSADNQESKQYPVDAIHYYPKDKRLVIEVEGGLSFALTQNPEGLMAQLLMNQAASQRAAVLSDDVVPAAESAEAAQPAVSGGIETATNPEPATAVPAVSIPPETPAASAKKRDNQFLLTGRLKTKPRDGKPDGSGKPTAWARFAAHLDGREEAWMLSTSFLRAKRAVALGLESGEQITVEGYVNKNPDPEKMDRYNVFRFINYRGKTQRDGSTP
jgi:hypothetical protein